MKKFNFSRNKIARSLFGASNLGLDLLQAYAEQLAKRIASDIHKNLPSINPDS